MQNIILYPFKPENPLANILSGAFLIFISMLFILPLIHLIGYCSRLCISISAIEENNTLPSIDIYEDFIFGLYSVVIIVLFYFPVILLGILSINYDTIRPAFYLSVGIFAVTYPIIFNYRKRSDKKLNTSEFLGTLLSLIYIKYLLIGFLLLFVSGMIIDILIHINHIIFIPPVLYLAIVWYFTSVAYGIRNYTNHSENS